MIIPELGTSIEELKTAVKFCTKVALVFYLNIIVAAAASSNGWSEDKKRSSGGAESAMGGYKSCYRNFRKSNPLCIPYM